MEMSNVLHLSSTNWNRLETINSTFSDAIHYLKQKGGYKVRVFEPSNPNLLDEDHTGDIRIQRPGMHDNWSKLSKLYPGIDLSMLRQTAIDKSEESSSGLILFNTDYDHFWCQKASQPKKIEQLVDPKLLVFMGGDIRITSQFFDSKFNGRKILEKFYNSNKSFVLESASTYSIQGFTHKFTSSHIYPSELNSLLAKLQELKSHSTLMSQEKILIDQYAVNSANPTSNRIFLERGLGSLYDLEDMYGQLDNVRFHSTGGNSYFIFKNRFFPHCNFELIMHNYVNYDYDSDKPIPDFDDLQDLAKKFEMNYIVLQDGMSLKIENNNGQINSGILNKLNQEYTIITPKGTYNTNEKWVPINLDLANMRIID